MNLIQPQLGLFFWTLVVFLTVFFLLRKFAWRPILNALKEREHDIESKLQAAAAAEEKMRQLTAENEKILAEARGERERIIREANDAKERIISEARTQAQAEAQKIITNANQQIQMEKNKAIAEIKNQTADLAITVAEQILRKKMENRKEEEALVKSLISDLKLN
jgi:F-type H+-transporting ATPase subunit b